MFLLAALPLLQDVRLPECPNGCSRGGVGRKLSRSLEMPVVSAMTFL